MTNDFRICFLSTAWGPHHGGINAFNFDLAAAVSELLPAPDSVFSVAIDPSDDDKVAASNAGINLVSLGAKPSTDFFDPAWAFEVWDKLVEGGISQVDCWVGHDVISGKAAQTAASKFGGAYSLIHHMSYARYQAIKHDDPKSVDKKIRDQRELFSAGGNLFSVGYLLADSCKEMSGREPTVLIPGFPSGLQDRSSDTRISAISLGRLANRDDRIKQGRLAGIAFGAATRNARNSFIKVPALSEPTMLLLGVDETEAQEITKQVDEEAGFAIPIIPLPYETNRRDTLERLEQSNLALMLSKHEGFGLTGWEALAAETPTIVSRNSGLYTLIEKTLGNVGLGAITVVDIQGRRGGATDPRNFTDADLVTVSDAILNIAAELQEKKKDAKLLKRLLIEHLGASWRHTAVAFLGVVAPDTPSIKEASETNDSANSNLVAPGSSIQRLESPAEYFLSCRKEIAETTSLYKSLVGPTFLLPEWWLQRRMVEAGTETQTQILKHKILEGSFSHCELILRNDLMRFRTNVAAHVKSDTEWDELIAEMLETIDFIFGAKGDRGPNIRCYEIGYTYLATLCDDSAIFAVRGAADKKVAGGWLTRDRETRAVELDRWRIIFDGIEQSKQEAVAGLKSFTVKCGLSV